MDIRGWPLDKIMQLPKSRFGRGYPVFLEARAMNSTPVYDIAEIALPEQCVIWWFGWDMFGAEVYSTYFRLALGDQLPATAAEMDALEPLFPGFGEQGAEPRMIRTIKVDSDGGIPMRLPIFSGGRRPVLEVVGAAVKVMACRVALVVSSIPTEIPG